MKDELVFIINPISGRRSKINIVDLIKNTILPEEYLIEYTKYRGDATNIARRYVNDGFTRIVAVGGDGTVNEVATAIVNTNTTLGIIPLGSGNGLARHLKIPINPRRALQCLIKGNQMGIDYGIINQKLFFCTTGVGFDAHIGDVFSRLEGRGFLNYIKATISEFRKYEPQQYEILLNGETITRNAFLVTFANASQYGNNAHIAPKADIQDGKLEVAILLSFPLIAAPAIAVRLFMKNIHKSSYLETFSCEKAILKRKDPDVIHYDGEPGEMDEELNVKVIHKGLNVFVK